MLYKLTLDGTNYTITYRGNHLIIQNDDIPRGQPCKKVVKIEEVSGYTYKIFKTKIKSAGGARGLFSFIVDCYKNNFMVCNANQILRAALSMAK